jgi:hypothetical protein
VLVTLRHCTVVLPVQEIDDSADVEGRPRVHVYTPLKSQYQWDVHVPQSFVMKHLKDACQDYPHKVLWRLPDSALCRMSEGPNGWSYVCLCVWREGGNTHTHTHTHTHTQIERERERERERDRDRDRQRHISASNMG